MAGVLTRKRFDLLEVVLIVGLVSLVVWALKPAPRAADPGLAELATFEATLGRERRSEHAEELLIRDFFKGRREGVFVDIGANHHEHFSNTWYLETVLGWSGIAVEPQSDFEPGYREHRPRTRFRPFFVSDTSDERARLFVPQANPLVASSSRDFSEAYAPVTNEVTAPTITLSDLLDREGIARVDFVNMDIELAEPAALAGFDIDRFRPSLVCIEAHPEVRQQILDYFHAHGYVVVAKYLRADPFNLYFTPAKTVTAPSH